VRASDPPIDTEKVDAVGFAAEHPLSLVGKPKRQSREEVSVAERRRCRKGIALIGLDETHRPVAERHESSIEPGIAEERRVLESLGRDERLGWSARARRDRLQRTPLRSREPIREPRQLGKQSP
jgi:hypothetical protein